MARKQNQAAGASAPAVSRVAGYRVIREPHYLDRMYAAGEIVPAAVVEIYAPAGPGSGLMAVDADGRPVTSVDKSQEF